MLNILQEARTIAAAPLSKIALYHRLGACGIGEASIVVAVSSPHRREAFEACSWIVDEVKQKAQIFKREYYEGEPESQASWKQNA
ncbi:Molybdopterin synthase catalytic subunit [Serendipita sp. 397]|nr:Molybdopterin synthase catalytic subunit [Serendipita sp. 397]